MNASPFFAFGVPVGALDGGWGWKLWKLSLVPFPSELMPDAEGLAKALREPLLKIFPPALLGRLVTIPYYPLSDDMLGQIVKLQLNRIKKRVEARYKIPFEYGDEVVKLVVSRCTESESGGRMIDAILTNTMLPDISREFLTRMMDGRAIEHVRVGVSEANFSYGFDAAG